MKDQCGAIHPAFGSSAVFVWGSIIGFGSLDHREGWRFLGNFLFGFTTLEKKATQHKGQEQALKNAFLIHVFWFSILPSLRVPSLDFKLAIQIFQISALIFTWR